MEEKQKPGKFQREGASGTYVLQLNAVCVNQRNLTELIVAVDVGNLLQLYASMLFERRILIFASKLSTVCYLVTAFIQHAQTQKGCEKCCRLADVNWIELVLSSQNGEIAVLQQQHTCKVDTVGEMCRCLNLSLFAADILRARAECCIVSHVLAAHLHPCTAATPAGLLLVK